MTVVQKGYVIVGAQRLIDALPLEEAVIVHGDCCLRGRRALQVCDGAAVRIAQTGQRHPGVRARDLLDGPDDDHASLVVHRTSCGNEAEL